jgi:enterochelin esterase-like enzyme
MRPLRLVILALLTATAAAQTHAIMSAPQVNPDRTVTFSFTAPSAAKVALAIETAKEPIPMQRGEAGVWTLTVPALAPEYYYYDFVVDGRHTLDPFNMEIVHSTDSVANSFLVPGATPQPWETANIPHGVVERHVYTSKVVQNYSASQSEYFVYTPPGYDPHAAAKYPVLYLLHGWSHRAGDWSGFGRANEILDALIDSGKARPMIVVMPTGYGDMNFVHDWRVWNDAPPVDRNTSLFASALLNEVIPQITRLYNVSSRREDRAIVGLSMGGLESLTIGLDHPDLFAYVGGMSAAVHLVDPAAEAAKLDPKAANLKLLWIACGTADGLVEPNRRLAAALKSKGFSVTTVETPDGLHTWTVWRENLVQFAPLLFQR